MSIVEQKNRPRYKLQFAGCTRPTRHQRFFPLFYSLLILTLSLFSQSSLFSQTTIFSADFENTSGQNNWTFNTTATDGDFVIGVPTPYVTSSTTQMEIAAQQGSQCLQTGIVDNQDLDGGPATATSPSVTISSGATSASLSFYWYFSHYTNGDNSDYMRVEVRDASNNVLATPVNVIGAATDRDAVWAQSTTDLSAHAGKTIHIYVISADLGGGSKVEAALDNVVLTETLPSCANVITNHEFDNGTTDWNLYIQSGNSATQSIDNTSQLSGSNSNHINISSASGTNWHIQLVQPGKSITNGTSYTVEFQARASSNRNMYVSLQETVSPWTNYWGQTVSLTTSPQTFTFNLTAGSTNSGNVGIYFNVGESSSDVWIDDVTFNEVCGCTGNADTYTSQTGVINPSNAEGAPDGSSAQLYDQNDQIVMDLTDALSSGTDYTIRWRKDPNTSADPDITVEESSNGSSWSAAAGSPFTFSNTSYFDQNITASTTTRYLRFTSNNIYNADLDAISYSCSGGGSSILDTTLCYYVSDELFDGSETDRFYSVNPISGVSTYLGNTGTTLMENLCIDPVTETLYGMDGARLGTINPNTGLWSAIAAGNIGNLDGSAGTLYVSDVDGLTFDVANDYLWASGRRGGEGGDEFLPDDIIFKVNKNTGLPIYDAFGANVDYLVISTPEDDIDDISIHPINGTLYAISNRSGTGSQRLITINKTNGSWTLIGDYGVTDVEGMGVTASGQILVTTGNDGNVSEGDRLWSIDPNTAIATEIAQLSDTDIEGCACKHAEYANAQISGNIWEDTDKDGIQDSGEPWISTVTVNLLNSDGSPVMKNGSARTTTSSISGYYEFKEIFSGDYLIEVVAPSGRFFTFLDVGNDDDVDSDVALSNGRTATISLTAGENIDNIDAGILAPGESLEICDNGTDDDSDGLIDCNDPNCYMGIGVPDSVSTSEGTLVNIPVVNNDVVAPGTWTVTTSGMQAPANGTLTYVSPGNYNYTPNANFVGFDQWTYQLCHTCGCDTVEVRVAVTCDPTPGSNEISGNVFLDPNSNGFPDQGEPWRQNAVVRYYVDTNKNGVIDGGESVQGTDLTDSNGHFSFTPTLGGQTITITKRIDGGTYDARQDASGDVSHGNANIRTNSNRIWEGMVFTGLNIPANAIITSAYITLRSNSSETVNTPVTFYGIKNVNPGEFVNSNYEISNRPRTTASVNWDIPSTISGSDYNTPSLVSLVQEVVNMAGYGSGNGNLGFVMNGGVGERRFDSYNGSTTTAPLLSVSYTSGDTTQYIINLDPASLSTGVQYTTPQNQIVSFPSQGVSNCLVNFGIIDDEICNNSIDDDGDGLIDCADPDCYNSLMATASTPDNEICNGESTTLNASASGGSGAGYTYAWSHGLGAGSSKSVSPTVNTTYSVTVTDGNGCTDSDQITITVNALPNANAGSNVTICNGENTTLGASGGTSYAWSPSTGLSATNIYNPIASPTTTRIYTVTVTDANGCTDTDQVTVSVDPLPTANASANQTICSGQSTNISSGASGGSGGGYTYAWSHSLGAGASKTVSPSISTLYTVTVTDGNGCTDSDQVLITVNSLPPADAGSNTAICIGSGTTLNASGGTSYAWSPSTGLSATNISNPIASPTTNRTYTVTVTDGNGCTQSDQVTITVYSLPTANAGANSTICFGGSTNITASASGGSGAGYTYAWSNGLGAGATKSVSPSVTTNYTVTVTDGNGCTDTDQVTVAVHDISHSGDITGAESGCDTYDPSIISTISAATVSTNGGLSGLNADYDFNGDIQDDSGNSHHGNQVGTLGYESGIGNRALNLDGSNGNYVAIVDHANLKPSQISISAWLKPSSATPAQYETAVFKSSDGNWTDGYGLAHYEGSSNINFYINNWETKVVSSSLTAGVYSHVVGTYDGSTLNLYINGTLASALVLNEAIVHVTDSLTIGYGDGGVPWNGGIDEVQIYNRALDAEEVQILYNLHNNIEYQWESSTNGGSSWSDISGATSETYNPGSITQTTHFRRKTRNNPCGAWTPSSAVIKTVYNLPTANAGSDVLICPNGSTTLGASGGVSYQWGPATGLSATNVANPIANPDTSTTYTVTVTDSNGCTDTDDVIVSMNPMTLTRTITRVSCPGESDGSIDLTINNPSGAYTIDWDIDGLGDNDDTEDQTGLSAGTYRVVVTDQNCADTLTVMIGTVNDYPFSAMILTAADATTFPTATVPGGYYFTFPTTNDTFDFTFDHSYIETGFVLDSNWTGAGRLTYNMYDGNPQSNLSHSVSDRATEYHDFNPTNKINESGRVYDVYGRGHFSFNAGTTQNHSWTLSYDFTGLDIGYLPAGTLIGFIDIDGTVVANEAILLTATLESGATTAWLENPPYDKGYNPPQTPHGEAVYVPGNNSYYFNGPDASNTAIAYKTNENLTSISMTLIQGFSGSSYGLKFAAPIHPLTYDVVSNDPNCLGPNGSITISPELPGVSYSINGGTSYQTSGSFSGLAASSYDIFIRNDSTGCVITHPSSPITLSDPNCVELCTDGLDNDDDGLVDCDDPDCYNGLSVDLIPSVELSSEGLLCLPGSIDITASASGGDGSYAFIWDNGLGVGSSHTVSPSSATIYNVTVTDGNGCEAYDQVIVNVFNSPTIIASPDSLISCIGIGVNLSATGGSSYQWSPTAGLSNPNIANPSADPSVPTTYYVTATDANGCTGVDSVYVEATSNIGNADAGEDVNICQGQGVMLSASGGVSYLWSPPIGLSDRTIQNPIANPPSTRTYTVIATDENGCTDVDQVQVTVLNNPNASITQDTVEICLGSGTTLLATGGGTYSWSPSNGLNATNIANPSAMPFTTTTYTVLVTDGNGCTDTDQVVVVVNDNTGNANAGPDQTICEGESANLSASGGVIYSWSPATGLNATNVANPIATPTTTTNYTVIATDENGCTDVDVVTINVNAEPSITTNGNQDICEGESVTLSVSGGVSYLWSPSTGLSADNIN